MSRCRHFEPLEFSARWRLEVKGEHPPFDFRTMFGDDRPVEVEIGHGKGSFLVEAAQALRDRNFIGMEWATGRHIFAAERIAKRDLGHVRLIRGDATEMFTQQIPAASLDAVHIYFPDPYWKKKHFKRRLVTPSFLLLLARALRPGGRVLLKSDVAERFAQMNQFLTECAEFRPLRWEEAAASYPPVVSNFERKAGVAGRPVECAAYARVESTTRDIPDTR